MLKSVPHDWSDEKATTILRNIREAMCAPTPGSCHIIGAHPAS